MFFKDSDEEEDGVERKKPKGGPVRLGWVEGGLTWGFHIMCTSMGVWVCGWSLVVLELNGLNLELN